MTSKYFCASLMLLLPGGTLFLRSGSVAQVPKFRIPFSVADSGALYHSVRLKVGVHPNATACLDNFLLTGFTDHWTETDSSSVLEIEPPPTGFGFDYRFSYPTAICSVQIWSEDIHQYVSATQRDTFRVRIQVDATQSDDIHALKFSWPSHSVLAQYADSIIIIKSTGLLRYRFDLRQQDSANVPYSISTYATTVSFFVIVQNPKTPPGPPNVTTIAPVDGATGVSLTPTFTWNAVSQAAYYRFQLAADSLFSNIVTTDSLAGSATSKTLVSSLSQGTTYYWRIVVSNPYGVSYYQNPPLHFQALGGTDVRQESPLVPDAFALHQNYPNPFNPATTITFDIRKTASTDVTVYDVLGRNVATLVATVLTPGVYSTQWNGTMDNGVPVSSGVYFVHLNARVEGSAERFTALRNLLLMK